MVYVETKNLWTTVGDLFYNQKAMQELVTSNWSVEILYFPFNSVRKRDAAGVMCHVDLDISKWDPKDDEVLCRLINPVGTV